MAPRLLLAAFMIVFGYLNLASQLHHSFVDEGNKWEVNYYSPWVGSSYMISELKYKKDTIIGADTIQILAYFDWVQTYEIDRRVYMFRPSIDTAFFLLYDWNLAVGDTFNTCYLEPLSFEMDTACTTLVLNSIDSVLLFDSTSYRTRMNFETLQSPWCILPWESDFNVSWIDGIGDTGYPFPPGVYCFEELWSSYCYSYEGEKLYFNCGLSSTEDEIRAPSVRIVPNPVSSIFRVETESIIEFVELIDLTGKPSKIPAPYDQDLSIPSHFSAGMYYLRVVLENGESMVLPLNYVK